MPEPRIPPVTEPTEEQREALGKGMARDGVPLNIAATLAHHPRLLRRFNVLGGAFLARGLVPEREREIVVLRVGWRCGSDYEFGQHTLIGREVGLTDDEIARLATEGTAGWDAGDRLLVALADELCAADTVDGATWAALAERWSDPQLLELVLLAGFYRMVSGFLNSVGVRREEGVPGFPAGTQPSA
ncbi:MAG: carboxymuconolactone decarboxylase family protein [Acidimicrobiia bacterium]|nr:carboxymuconolactone decarboxylase family protein [Acidimicrobiia bacterium]